MAPSVSDNVIFVPPIKFNVSVDPIAEPSAWTVLNVFVSPVSEIQEPEPEDPE